MITQAAFIDMVRQFRSAAQRKRRSYAPGVNAALALWREAVMAGEGSDAEKMRRVEWAGDFVLREYASSDASYELPPGN